MRTELSGMTAGPRRMARLSGSAAPAALARGFTVIELAVVITVLGIILALGVPGFSNVLIDNAVRARAESAAEGLRVARLEAIHRNSRATIDFDGAGWSVSVPDSDGGDDLVVRGEPSISSDEAFTVDASHDQILFNGTGRPNVGDFSIAFGHQSGACEAEGGNVRCLRVQMNPRGIVRLCDPMLSAPEPRSCD